LRSCLLAVESGVGAVHICGFDGAEALIQQLSGNSRSGTVIVPD